MWPLLLAEVGALLFASGVDYLASRYPLGYLTLFSTALAFAGAGYLGGRFARAEVRWLRAVVLMSAALYATAGYALATHQGRGGAWYLAALNAGLAAILGLNGLGMGLRARSA